LQRSKEQINQNSVDKQKRKENKRRKEKRTGRAGFLHRIKRHVFRRLFFEPGLSESRQLGHVAGSCGSNKKKRKRSQFHCFFFVFFGFVPQ
jgi:hypothetical protein